MLLVSYAVMAAFRNRVIGFRLPNAAPSRRLAVFAERAGVGQFAHGFRHIAALPAKIVLHGAAEGWIDDVMRRVGGLGQIAPRDLVLALRAGFDPLQPASNRKID